MLCPKCGKPDCVDATSSGVAAFLERGAFNPQDNSYEEESDVTVQECRHCKQEFIVI